MKEVADHRQWFAEMTCRMVMDIIVVVVWDCPFVQSLVMPLDLHCHPKLFMRMEDGLCEIRSYAI